MQGYNCILVYSEDRREILFCKRLNDPYEGMYNLVGGKIEPGEDGFHAAYRELFEETGISREDVTLYHMMDFTYYNQNCFVEVYTGVLQADVELRPEKHPLHWISAEENFFDLEKYAGEGYRAYGGTGGTLWIGDREVTWKICFTKAVKSGKIQ